MTSTDTAGVLGGVFRVGGDMPVHRIGYGSMQLTGPGHWYHPADTDHAKRILRRAVELGVDHIDTADAYGPATVEHLIRKALHPYPDGLVIATKGGLTRQGPNRWAPVGRPEYLRQCVEMSLRRLALDRIDLYYLHRVDPKVPLADQVGELAALRDEGKIRHIGVSKVTIDQILEAERIVQVAAVQNRFNLHDQSQRAVLDFCTAHGIAFVPFAPLACGDVLEDGTPASAIRWLLDQSPAVLLIPGTGSLEHLESNLAALSMTWGH
ncbi:aldo/keto reductase [Nocardia cyriacigeorgica]|uniref:aldo/keto reductase n=1 Tax=Nocardia cyriacigeorgica TaxID=135487 RepID=UPI0002F6EC05|nr:aldo/keto reductase [Nocardia cyriacigeorgica]TLF59496.1 aldo/keto reductase [Nocardia cyriacigeorgica]